MANLSTTALPTAPMLEQVAATLRQDYQTFPYHQTFEMYAPDVYFRDPVTQFQGRERYEQLINQMNRWFRQIRLDLQQVEIKSPCIVTQWTLHWIAPLPWSPPVSIPGWSEILVNGEGLVTSHIDYWYCSRWQVVRQHLGL